MTTHEHSGHKLAVYMILRRGNEVLLAQRANTNWQNGGYAVPAGHVEPRETLPEAVGRELREEVGVEADLDSLRLVHAMDHRDGERYYVDMYFEVGAWTGEPHNAEPEFCSDVAWFGLDALPEALLPNVRQALEAVGRGETYSVYTWQ